jgi:hypothetical protein
MSADDISVTRALLHSFCLTINARCDDRMKGFIQKLNCLTSPASTSARLRLFIDLAALAWIAWFAWRYAGFLLRDDLYLYGDHPGQFYRLWQLLSVTWPEEGRLIGWSPHWQAGRPELQFYPPGFFFAGWLIWMGSFQQLSLFSVYQTLVFACYILPAISFYLLMAWGLGDRLAGLAAAWLALTAPFPLGGAQGTIIGITGYQLAFGLNPLLILIGVWGLRAKRKELPWLITGLTLAGTMLLHPFQAIFPMGVLILYALFCGQGWWVRLRWLMLVILLGLGLIAFWWLPLGTQLQSFVPVVEANLTEIRAHFENMWPEKMGGLLIIAALVGSFFRSGHRRWLSLAILGGGVGMLGYIFFNYLILVEQFHLFILDSVRLIPGVTFALFIGLGLGLSELSWSGVRLLRRWGWSALALPLVLIVPWLVYCQVTEEYDFAEWMRKWQPAPNRTPFFLSEAEAKYGLPAVWEIMAATPGRVLFTSHYGLLFDIPTSLKAATPIFTGREIVGGVFTLRSHVASYLWTGQSNPPVLRGKIEQEDDKSLAGVTWEAMSDEFLFDLARRFNVTLIATTATDVRAQAFLDTAAHFNPIWSNGLFTLYDVADYEPTWAEAEQATAMVSRYERTAIDVQITEAQPGATLSVKVAHFPRWQAEAQGQPLPIQTDNYGLMRLALPPGSYTVHLRYGPGWPEQLGGVVSLMTFLGAVGIVLGRWVQQLREAQYFAAIIHKFFDTGPNSAHNHWRQ